MTTMEVRITIQVLVIQILYVVTKHDSHAAFVEHVPHFVFFLSQRNKGDCLVFGAEHRLSVMCHRLLQHAEDASLL